VSADDATSSPIDVDGLGIPDGPLAIDGGTPTCQRAFPRWPIWDDTERDGLLGVLDHGGWWHGDGDQAATFADEFAAFQGASFGLAMTNGTHTIEAALAALDVGHGDEVIVPAMTFVASASAVMAVNATPVFVDIDPDTLCIDVAAAEAAITERTKAIVAVHVAGAAADLDALVGLCGRRGIALVEDCAHAHGTQWRGRGVGSWGSFGSFSMQRSKLMTAGEGGALLCNDEALRDLAWSYADCGRARGEWFYHHVRYGSNLRMTEWQGAVLRAQLRRFPEQHRIRNERALLLNAAIDTVPGLRAPRRDPRMDSQGNYCVVFHYDAAEFAGLPLRRFEAALAAEGVPMSVSYPALNDLAVFRTGTFGARWRNLQAATELGQRLSATRFPVAEHASQATVWLQHRLLLADPDVVLDVARAAERIRRSAPRRVKFDAE
jgi:dTDP-4-amino-4,6-dideoxygalactose transaminase